MKSATFVRITFIAMLFIFSSCVKFNQMLNPGLRSIEGSKKIVDDIRPLEEFHSVQIEGFNVFLVQDTVNKIRLNGEDNVLVELHDTIINGVLTLFYSELTMIHHNQPTLVYVHFKNLNEIISDNGIYKSVDTIKTRSMHVKSNSGSFELTLQADTLRAEMHGNGRCHGTLLASGYVKWSNVKLTTNGVFDSPELKGESCYISFNDKCCYQIRIKNFGYTNVLLPMNCFGIPEFVKPEGMIGQ